MAQFNGQSSVAAARSVRDSFLSVQFSKFAQQKKRVRSALKGRQRLGVTHACKYMKVLKPFILSQGIKVGKESQSNIIIAVVV